jgi:hypothetical protein
MNKTEDQLPQLYKAFSFRVKDATSGKRLVALANAVNTVWNYSNEISIKSAERGPRWITIEVERPAATNRQRARYAWPEVASKLPLARGGITLCCTPIGQLR